MTPLPCPWCKRTSVIGCEGSTYRWYVAVCACDARGPEVRAQRTESGSIDVDASKVAAIVEWNRREE